jgi:prepilin-type N-terminal cleavage/methylation domain-containing protein
MKKAFTMMELIFVIVVIGILAAVVIPRTGSNKLNEAAIQVVSHIRYTQHLAMVDDKFDTADSNWYRGRWQIIFGTSNYTNDKYAYSIFSDAPTYSGQPDKSEMAKNPLDSTRLLSGGYSGTLHIVTDADEVTKEMNIGQKYGIENIAISGGNTGSSASRVVFDHLGRPYRGDISDVSVTSSTSRLANSTIYIKFCLEGCTLPNSSANNDKEVVIAVEPETGYAHIL